MGASFKKAETIKSNLKVIAANKDTVAGQGELMLDPNFFAHPASCKGGGLRGSVATSHSACGVLLKFLH